jgi:hypothetical protein
MYDTVHDVDTARLGPDESIVYVLTDHRKPEEIEENAPLSSLLAVLRTLAAFRQAVTDGRPFIVWHDFMYEPPAFLKEDIENSSGVVNVCFPEERLLTEKVEVIASPLYSKPRHDAMADVVNRACADLADKICASEELELTLDGLALYEERVFERVSPEDREGGGDASYWSHIVSLGVFAGETIRKVVGGVWLCQFGREGWFPTSLVFAGRRVGENQGFDPVGQAIVSLDYRETGGVAFMAKATIANWDEERGLDGL